jgi:transcriptional regulator with XRE-family HTH domain
MAEKRVKLSDQVRRAVDNCGQTRYRIAKETGISEPTLSRFMSGERGLPMTTLDRLADHLGLDIVRSKTSETEKRK